MPPLPAFPVVGVGASAGGLEAFTELLRHLPIDTGMAFVLVQHLDPSRGSQLPELLSSKTAMRVIEARNNLPVAPNTVYVIPAAQDMTIEQGVLKLRSRPPSGHHLPVDSFLTSLARDRTSAAIAVILSGTAADGAAGIRVVRAEGGVTLAQDPATAKYAGMPQAAIATGAVDFVLPTPLLARQLALMAGRPMHSPITALGKDSPPASGEDFLLEDLLAIVRSATKADFTHYRQSTVHRRIERRMMMRHVEDLEEYVKLLRSDPNEVEALYQDLLIRVTSFFRQPSVFETLKDGVFPRIAEARAGQQVRFWVPGCATGEEAYSLAMAWAEFSGMNHPGKTSFQVFATDINQQAIDKARAGVYPDSIASDLSPERLARFFTAAEGGYRVVEGLRETCVFARHDLTRDPPFSRLDLISLRNVLIYLGPLLQRRVLPALHFALRPGGFLLLGESESVGSFSDLFLAVDRKAKIFARKEGLGAVVPPHPLATGQGAGVPEPTGRPQEFNPSQEADRIVLEGYAPAGVLVDADLQIRQFRGRPEPYLELGPGRASFDLIRLAREGLAGELRSALREAQKEGSAVVRRGIRILREGQLVAVGLDVVPIKSPSGELSFLILFLDMPQAPATRPRGGPAPAPEVPEDPSDKIADLARELGEMREHARAVLEDKESANEELRSANEELQSANEELQSLNEELETTSEEVQSSNEELRTLNEEMSSLNERLSRLNEELGAKNAELRELNAALNAREVELTAARDYAQAVIDTVREPLLVLDSKFRVVSASPPFYSIFRMDPHDTVGCIFFELDGGQWDTKELRAALGRVVDEGGDFQDFLVEKDFARLGRRSMVLSGRRIHKAGEALKNVLVAIEDITERTKTEAAQEQLIAKLEESARDLAAHQEEMEVKGEELRLAHEETARLLEEESSLLGRLQEVFLDIPRELPGVEFGHLYRSATSQAQVGGDFYDVFDTREGRIGLLIGDVSGHGIEAAREATLVKDTIHAFAHQFRRPHLVLRETNRLLVERNLPGFVTVFLGFLDPDTGTLVFSSAGHPPPLVALDGRVSLLQSSSPPLGTFPGSRYRDDEIQANEGSVLLLYTDGITEARRSDGDLFGERSLVASLERWSAQPVEVLPARLMDEVLLFSSGRLQDDAAILAVRYVGKTERTVTASG